MFHVCPIRSAAKYLGLSISLTVIFSLNPQSSERVVIVLLSDSEIFFVTGVFLYVQCFEQSSQTKIVQFFFFTVQRFNPALVSS